MLRRQVLSTLAALPALAGMPAAHTEPGLPAKAGETVRWPEVMLLDGSRWSATRAAGKAVVVVFWSTTCPFCLRHNAHVAKLQQQTAGLPLEIVTVATDRDAVSVRRYLDTHGYRFAVTLDHKVMAAALSTRRMIPLTVTVGRDGRLRQVIPGEMFEDDVLELARLAA